MTSGLPCPAGALDVRRQVSDLVGSEVPAMLVFDYPTIEEIAEFVAGKAAESLAAAAKRSAAAAPASGTRSTPARQQRTPAGAVAAAPRRAAPPPAPALTLKRKLELVTDTVRSRGGGPGVTYASQFFG